MEKINDAIDSDGTYKGHYDMKFLEHQFKYFNHQANLLSRQAFKFFNPRQGVWVKRFKGRNYQLVKIGSKIYYASLLGFPNFQTSNTFSNGEVISIFAPLPNNQKYIILYHGQPIYAYSGEIWNGPYGYQWKYNGKKWTRVKQI